MSSKIGPANPLGILSIDHLEFCAGKKATTIPDLFYRFGFSIVGKSEKNHSTLFSQGQIRFVLNQNEDPKASSHAYFKKHGEGVCTISFLVENAEHALNESVKRGGKLISKLNVEEAHEGLYKTARIAGFGDVQMEFVERPMTRFRPDFSILDHDPKEQSLKCRLARIDHLTNNVPKGEMRKWSDYYQQVFGFKVTRYFDIKGQKTGLQSEVVQLEGGAVIIPINEPDAANGKSQIQEFLDLHKGPGVQHIALTTAKITDTIEDLQKRNIEFLKIPHTYYEDIKKRGLNPEENLKLLEERQLLVDGDEKGYLLQNFTQTFIGPLFFEFIQRKNHNGFGEGNFQALFDAIERDQLDRGYIK